MKLSSTFEKISREFKIQFDELAGEISHNLISGESREYALIELLKNYLPNRVGIDTGFVIDAEGRESKQIDVIVYDKTVGTVFHVNNVKYFPCETVISVGEVKSNIDSSNKMNDALEKINSVKSLDRSNNGKNLIITGPGVSIPMEFDPNNRHRDQIFGFIFTSTSLERKNIVQLLQNYNELNPRRNWTNVFCAFNQFLISYECPGALFPSAMEAEFLYCTEESEIPNLLLLFYCILARAVDETHVARPNFFSYAQINKTEAKYFDLFPPLVTHAEYPLAEFISNQLDTLPDFGRLALPYCLSILQVEKGELEIIGSFMSERGLIYEFKEQKGTSYRVVKPSMTDEDERLLMDQVRTFINSLYQ